MDWEFASRGLCLKSARSRSRLGPALELRHRPVFVVEALDREHRTMYPRQDLLDVPAAESRIEPDIVPSPECLRGVGVIAAELLREVRALEGGLRLGDALHADVFDEDMRRH